MQRVPRSRQASALRLGLPGESRSAEMPVPGKRKTESGMVFPKFPAHRQALNGPPFAKLQQLPAQEAAER